MRKLLAASLICLLLCLHTACGEVFTPGRETCGQPHCFWETPMDVTDEEAIWQMLTGPMTVISGDWSAQKYVYAQPDQTSAVVAEVTCRSQGVHVVSQENGWARIELYSSSFKGSRSKAWAQLVTGYVPSGWLMDYKVRTRYGFIVDKLTQCLYIFENGALYDTLAISTGLPNERQPYNETRAGDFIMYTRTGAFKSDNLICDMGIRFNAGDLIHEVPHVVYSNGKSDYNLCAVHLGERASHGCIRVQRKRTPKGTSMDWIWKAMKNEIGTRLVIWEDWPGRTMAIPEDSMLLYMEPNGKVYHAAETCRGVKESRWPMPSFTYGELEDDAHRKLTQCDYCYPALRVSQIEAVNAAHLPEGAQPEAVLPEAAEAAAPAEATAPAPTRTPKPAAPDDVDWVLIPELISPMPMPT